MTLDELMEEARRLSDLLDRGVKALHDSSVQVAHAEHAYRKKQAEAWLMAPDGTAPAKQAWVDGECADHRLARDLVDASRNTSQQALRARTAQLSAVQSLLATLKAEVNLAR